MNKLNGEHLRNVNNNSISLLTLHRKDSSTFVRIIRLLITRDIWVPHCIVSLDHFTHFFILGIETLFQVVDKLLRVEALGLTSCILSWKLCEKNDFRLRWQLESSDEQTFSLLPIAFQDLAFVVEGEHQEFFDNNYKSWW
jgi:hypothetical protein